jgi:phosphoribosylaminoimidazole-succinocarboxamide synthase
MSKHAITSTQLSFPYEFTRYQGKVRDVYTLKELLVVMVATDRISAFDVVLPRAIPYKGQVLNQIASHFLMQTEDIVPNYLLDVPDPNISIGLNCKPLPVEFVVRGYLCGHAWREYASGNRVICGVTFPDGLRENSKLPEPVLTPTTKSKIGHDLDISADEIVRSGLLDGETFGRAQHYALALFQRGQEMADARGLILADSKYEFGLFEEDLYVIDEIHTPDSSRYFMKDGYEALLLEGLPQRQLSKEFVREWLIAHDFMGRTNDVIPEMDDEFVNSITQRYIELYELLTGNAFIPADYHDWERRIQVQCNESLKKLGIVR